jgi:ComF family protein
VESADLGGLCGICWKGLRILHGAEASRRGKAWAFDEARAYGAFEGGLREAVHAWKFSARTSFIRPFVGLLASVSLPADLVSWPPTARASIKERGFDPAQELARSLSRSLGLPLYHGLKRLREGEKQASLGREERFLNTRGAFTASPKGLHGRSVLLVDDVITTGATLSACAAALKEAGASSVVCALLASGGLKGL